MESVLFPDLELLEHEKKILLFCLDSCTLLGEPEQTETMTFCKDRQAEYGGRAGDSGGVERRLSRKPGETGGSVTDRMLQSGQIWSLF